MLRAIVFDLDGTLVTFKVDYSSLRTEIIQSLKDLGVPDSLLSERRALLLLENARKYLTEKNEAHLFDGVKKKIYSIIDAYETKAAESTELISGSIEALKFVRERGFKLGLCSVSGEKAVAISLGRFQLRSFFDAIITREYTPKPKPFTDHLETVLKALNVKSNEAIVVGDSIIDMIPAKALNVIAIGVASGVYARSPEELSKAGATYIISSIRELPELLKQILESFPD